MTESAIPLVSTNDDNAATNSTNAGGNASNKPDNKMSVLEKFKDYFTTNGAIGFIKDKQITLKNIIIAFVSFGLERLINSELFDCPLKNHQRYGNCFLFVPAWLLFCANLLIIGEVWKITRRCCVKEYHRRGEVFYHQIPSLFKAMVGPAAWLVGSYANADYYVCATVGPGVDKRNSTGNMTDAERKTLEEQLATATALSHIWTWLVLAIAAGVGALIVILKNCCLKDAALLQSHIYTCQRREAVAAKLAFETLENGETIEDLKKSYQEQDGKITQKFGDEEQFYVYLNGIPEKTGITKVEKIFKDAEANYCQAYNKFSEMYPRVVTGHPADSWVADADDRAGFDCQACCVSDKD